MAEVLFYRLLVTVDDFGRFDARPAMIKSQCFPIKEKTTPKHCEDALKELCESGLVMVYVVDGKPYVQILKWDNVPRSKESKFPAPTDDCAHMYTSVCNPRTVLPVTVTETKTETKTVNSELPAPEGVSDQVWQDFKKSRKTLRAAITQSAIDGIKREADKAGWPLEDALRECCARGWRGFKAEWVADKPKQTRFLPPQPNETIPSKQGIDPELAKIIADGLKTGPPPAEIRAKLFGKTP